MKKFLLKTASIAFIAFTAVAFSACGDDEPEAPKPPTTENGDDSSNEEVDITGNYSSTIPYLIGGSLTTTYLPNGMEDITSTPGVFCDIDVEMTLYANGNAKLTIVEATNAKPKGKEFNYTYEMSEDNITFKSTQYTEAEPSIYKFKYSKGNLALEQVSGPNLLYVPGYTVTEENQNIITERKYDSWVCRTNELNFTKI